MGGFCLGVELHWGGYTTNGATPPSYKLKKETQIIFPIPVCSGRQSRGIPCCAWMLGGLAKTWSGGFLFDTLHTTQTLAARHISALHKSHSYYL